MPDYPTNTPDTEYAKGTKVLIVDDEPQNLQLVGEILRRVDLPFIFAINGEEALEVAIEQQPTLILLDVMMPGTDGLGVCKELKANKLTEHIPVIFLTAASDASDIISGFAAGGVDYIIKPFIREELLARVHTHLNLHQARQQLKNLYQRKTELLTTLAHDVKNPAGAIAGLTSIIKEDLESSGDTANRSDLSMMLTLLNESATGMLQLVDETLNEEKLNANEIQRFTDVQISVNEVIDHLVQLNTILARKRNIELRFEASIQPTAGISRRFLTEMFDNLISNAVKYSRPDSTITIRLTPASSFDNGFRIEVEDCAETITPALKEALFKKFAKGQKPPEDNQSSHGVGLAIVKRLVELYEGTIGVNSRSDASGNCFFLEIPLKESA